MGLDIWRQSAFGQESESELGKPKPPVYLIEGEPRQEQGAKRRKLLPKECHINPGWTAIFSIIWSLVTLTSSQSEKLIVNPLMAFPNTILLTDC